MSLTSLRTYLLLAGLTGSLVTSSFAQSKSPDGRYVKASITADGSIDLGFQNVNMTESEIQNRLNSILNLPDNFSFVKEKEKTDASNIKHIKFQQYYQGIKVESGTVLLHVKKGTAVSLNGKIMTNPAQAINVHPVIKKEEALAAAQKSLNVVRLNNQYAPELVIFQQKGGTLAYKTRIDGFNRQNKLVMYQVYVSAINGEVLNKTTLIAHGDVQGTAQTYYSGVRQLTTDSIAGAFRLRDNQRKIETYSARGLTPQMTAPLYANPNDITNTSTTWGLQTLLESVSLDFAADSNRYRTGFMDVTQRPAYGWLMHNKVEKLVTAPSTYSTASDRDLVEEFFSTGVAASVPVKDPVKLLMEATKYRGAFNKDSLNIVLTPDGADWQVLQRDTNMIRYSIDTLTPGSHQWTNMNGDRGTYVIGKAVNPALDVHWGMGKTHDFYKNTFNYYSYNNDSNAIITNYYDGIELLVGNQNNAVALPAPHFAMVYGTGDGVMMNPVVSLDVVGHEFSHLVTGSNADLIYAGESGALNESFSDMMGQAIVGYAKGQDSVTWNAGERVMVAQPYMRSLSTPKALANFGSTGQPDTYRGQYWADTTDLGDQNDNGGVHTNSGVGNKWFYLMAHGGSGTNDNQYTYNVTALGMAKAQKIAFSTFTDYLTSTSKYIDAYTGSLQATAAIYGQSSTEYNTVKEAWKAVGIPSGTTTAVVPARLGNEHVDLYPNPSNGIVYIKSSLKGKVDAGVYSATGAKVKDISISSGTNTYDMTQLARGIYFVEYSVGNDTYSHKVVLQ